MHQRRGLQGLAGIFARHFLRGEFAQFFVHKREEFICRVRVALINALENDGEFAHAGIITGFHGRKEAQNGSRPVSSPR